MSDKTILEQWRSIAYDQQADRNKLQRFWANYFNIEKGIYEKLLANPDEVVTGTVKELADKYGLEVLTMVGFLDGINDSDSSGDCYEYYDIRDYGTEKRKCTKRNKTIGKTSTGICEWNL